MRNLMLAAGLLLAGEACAGSSARVGTAGANAAEALAPRRFTVMSWNTQHYGWDNKSKEKQTLLEQNMFDVIRAVNPDVFLQQETYGSFERFKAALPEYRSVLQSECNSLFSKFPIVATNGVWADPMAPRPLPMNACTLAYAELDLGGMRVRVSSFAMFWLPLCIFVPTDLSSRDLLAWEARSQAYPMTPRPQAIRMALAALAPVLADCDVIPFVIGGDFNSFSHLDWTAANGAAARHCGRAVPWAVSKAMFDAGFVDSWRAVHPDAVANNGVTAPMPGAVKDVPNPHARIDYLYSAGSRVKAVAAEIVAGPYHKPFIWRERGYSAFPSDHAALVVTYEFR